LFGADTPEFCVQFLAHWAAVGTCVSNMAHLAMPRKGCQPFFVYCMCITLLTVLLCVGGASEQAAKYKASDSRKFGAQTGPGAVPRNIGWSRPITHNHGSR
jgi:hypothetical protein